MLRISPLVAALLVFEAVQAFGNGEKRRRPAPVAFTPPTIAAANVGSITASPGTITFTATDPDLGSVTGSSPATVTWSVSGGNNANNWTLSVEAGSSLFSGCATVPVSAVTVACGTASVSGGAGTGACSGAFLLSTLPQQVAGGKEGSGTRSYSVGVNFTLADKWRYIAAQSPPCSLTLTYTVNAP